MPGTSLSSKELAHTRENLQLHLVEAHSKDLREDSSVLPQTLVGKAEKSPVIITFASRLNLDHICPSEHALTM